jgi:hypothetical protein
VDCPSGTLRSRRLHSTAAVIAGGPHTYTSRSATSGVSARRLSEANGMFGGVTAWMDPPSTGTSACRAAASSRNSLEGTPDGVCCLAQKDVSKFSSRRIMTSVESVAERTIGGSAVPREPFLRSLNTSQTGSRPMAPPLTGRRRPGLIAPRPDQDQVQGRPAAKGGDRNAADIRMSDQGASAFSRPLVSKQLPELSRRCSPSSAPVVHQPFRRLRRSGRRR